jgi:hypothetical protein
MRRSVYQDLFNKVRLRRLASMMLKAPSGAVGPDGMMNGGARQAVFGVDETEQPAKN